MQYSEVLASLRRNGDGWSATIPEEWLQGRTAFGGLQVALAVRAMREALASDVPLRTLQVTFVAPVAAGEVQVEARVLRSGKSATHVEARLSSGGQLGCLLIAIFGSARASKVAIAPALPNLTDANAKPIELPYLPGLTPNFTQHLSFRLLAGGLPFSAASRAQTATQVRLRDTAATGEAQVIALADSIPSPALSLLKLPAMASSLTWTLELLSTPFVAPAGADWRIDAEVTAAGDGYVNQSAILFAPDGTAVALSRQSVVMFA